MTEQPPSPDPSMNGTAGSTTGPPPPSSPGPPRDPLNDRIGRYIPYLVQVFGMSMIGYDLAFVHPISGTVLSIGGMLAGGGGFAKFARKGGL
jgi:hypothetical protein